MDIRVYPGPSGGRILAPPSKSLGHRAALCAMLAEGESRLTRLPDSQDMEATLAAAALWGARVERRGDAARIQGDPTGGGYRGTPVFCRESGSTLRFLIPVFATRRGEACFTGSGRLMERPQEVYAELFRERGLPFALENGVLRLRGPLTPGTYGLDGGVSSQFVSGLLFALPLLAGDSVLEVRPPFTSRSYALLTTDMLVRFGVHVEWTKENVCRIPGGQRYRGCDYAVEGDDSQAAFFAVLGAVNRPVEIEGLARDSRQGDRVAADILRDCGAEVLGRDGAVSFAGGALHAQEIDRMDCPDLGPILTVLGLFCQGTTRIYHAGRLRYKESDRIAAMETELRKLGAQVASGEDEVFVTGGRPLVPAAPLEGHNDHRIVMALAVAATRAQAPVIIRGAEAVRKSYPGFWEDLARAGIHWEEVRDV